MSRTLVRPPALTAGASLVAALALTVGGCGGGGSTELVVSAASSLTDAFEVLAEDFEEENPDVDVLLNVDSSATLANQIDGGAPVDVYASADAANMTQVVESERAVGDPVPFATNDLVIVTRPGNEFGVAGPADLVRVVDEGEVVALCAESAPCGRLAADLFVAELDESFVTRAPNARATLGAVTRGDAAAGVVYRTDARAAGDAVELVDVAGGEAVSTDYLAVVISDGPGEDSVASAFLELLLSAEGREVLEGEGFR